MTSAHRTFHDDFDGIRCRAANGCRTYAGRCLAGRALLGGDNPISAQTSWNGEQQIYVDPRYADAERQRSARSVRGSTTACFRSSPAARHLN